MKIKLRKASNGWGVVEKHDIYTYTNATTVTHIYRLGTAPVVHRGQRFLSLQVIEEEMGIDKYLRAKKTFYSVIDNRENDGPLVEVKVRYSYGDNYELIDPEIKSISFLDILYTEGDSAIVKKVPLDSTKIFNKFHKDLEILLKSKASRKDFLLSRLEYLDSGISDEDVSQELDEVEDFNDEDDFGGF